MSKKIQTISFNVDSLENFSVKTLVAEKRDKNSQRILFVLEGIKDVTLGIAHQIHKEVSSLEEEGVKVGICANAKIVQHKLRELGLTVVENFQQAIFAFEQEDVSVIIGKQETFSGTQAGKSIFSNQIPLPKNIPVAINGTIPMGVDSTIPMGVDSTIPMGVDSTIPMGVDSTIPMGVDRTIPMGVDSTIPMRVDGDKNEKSKSEAISREKKEANFAQNFSPEQATIIEASCQKTKIMGKQTSSSEYSFSQTQEETTIDYNGSAFGATAFDAFFSTGMKEKKGSNEKEKNE